MDSIAGRYEEVKEWIEQSGDAWFDRQQRGENAAFSRYRRPAGNGPTAGGSGLLFGNRAVPPWEVASGTTLYPEIGPTKSEKSR
jgi:hypothetical protein